MKILNTSSFIIFLLFSQFSISETTQGVVDEVMEIAAQDSGVAQGTIIYGNLNIKYDEFAKEWNSKYAHTDSSLVDYNEVKVFVDRVKSKYKNSKKYLYLTEKVKSFNDEASYIVELYRLFVNRGNTYLGNIKKDNDYRRDITRAMNNAIRVYDEDILATLDRMKDIIKNRLENDKVREDMINVK